MRWRSNWRVLPPEAISEWLAEHREQFRRQLQPHQGRMLAPEELEPMEKAWDEAAAHPNEEESYQLGVQLIRSSDGALLTQFRSWKPWLRRHARRLNKEAARKEREQ